MLKYLILSTPRCGSSTLMLCAESVLGTAFVREPLNPYEDPSLHPQILRRASIEERLAVLTDPRCPVEGIKHVHSPFNQRMAGEEAALRGLLSLRGLKVILLSRRDVAAQFISMEIALQTGDWWSAGPGALPKAIGPVRAGSEASLDDAAIAARLLRLSRAAEWLKQLCTATGARFVERSYEDLFCEDRDRAGRRVASVLKHFAPVTGKTRALRVIIGKGQRFNEVDALRRQLGKLYPSLRKSTDSRRQTATKLPMRARGGRVRADSSGARR